MTSIPEKKAWYTLAVIGWREARRSGVPEDERDREIRLSAARISFGALWVVFVAAASLLNLRAGTVFEVPAWMVPTGIFVAYAFVMAVHSAVILTKYRAGRGSED